MATLEDDAGRAMPEFGAELVAGQELGDPGGDVGHGSAAGARSAAGAGCSSTSSR